MNTLSLNFLMVFLSLTGFVPADEPSAQETEKPQIVKLGTIDCDLVETTPIVFHGQLIINYSWGNQRGEEFLAEAIYNGTLEQFLKGWFPD